MLQAGWRFGVKRAFDLTVASALLVASAPALACAAGAVRWWMGSPVLFRQVRPGRDGRPFTIYKLRTMVERSAEGGRREQEERSAEGGRREDEDAGSDAARLTAVGRVLRALSLDELPQLWNVLRGEMSLVGPRPLLMQYLGRYDARQARRHEVLPGITGWAQVHGRNELSHERKFELDVWYVEHWSLALDARILWLTLRALASRSGVSARGHATMPEFLGTARGTTAS